MAQHDYIISNQSFPNTRSDLNNSLSAIVSNNSGATEPTTTYAYQWWYDETTDILKMRNADNDAWITMFTFYQTADTYSLATDVELTITENLDLTGSATISGDLTVDTDTLYVDSTDNRVGIGIVPSGARLEVSNGDSGVTPFGDVFFEDDAGFALVLATPNSDSAVIDFADPESNNVGQIGYNHSDNSMTFDTNGSEAMRLDSSGHAIIPNGVTLGTATGTYSASNTLDDYEEGSWTPIYSSAGGDPSSVTYDQQEGYYQKIGNFVYAWFAIRTDAINISGMSGDLYVRNLPYNSDGNITLAIFAGGDVWADNFVDESLMRHIGVLDGTPNIVFAPDGTTSGTNYDNLDTGANDNLMKGFVCYPTTGF